MSSGGEPPKETELSKETKAIAQAPPSAATQVDGSAEPPAVPSQDASSEQPVVASTVNTTQIDTPIHEKTATTTGKWPELSADHPLTKLNQKLPELIAQATYSEVYGLDIDPNTTVDNTFHRNLILQKFLRANANDVEKAAEQLLGTLKWRKDFKALEARDGIYSKAKFDKLGYITRVKGVPGSSNESDVATFNIYGAVKDKQATFGDTESFMRWRVALMELSLQSLNLAAATEPIPDYGKGPDPYQGIQVHDYLNVSFLRQDPHVKAASTEAINTFKKYYPETVSRKFFVNVPWFMSWVMGAAKMLMNAEMARKLSMVSDGKQLTVELGGNLPEEYGGNGGKLADVSQGTKLE